MKDETSTVSPEFEAFAEGLDAETRVFLEKLRGPGVRRSTEEELRWLCEQHQEGMEDARAIAARLRRHDGFRAEIDALAERLRRVEEVVNRLVSDNA